MSEDAKKIYFMITNANLLAPRVKVAASFDQSGGTIGSHDGNDGTTWYLGSANPQIQAQHCSIHFADNAFHIRKGLGDTYVNHSSNPLHAKYPAQLNDGDQLQIGPYHIQVSLTAYPQQEHKKNLEDYFQYQHDLIDGATASDIEHNVASINQVTSQDPLPVLDTDITGSGGDLLANLHTDLTTEAEHILANDYRFEGSLGTVQADTEYDIRSSFTPPSIKSQNRTTQKPVKKPNAIQRFSTLLRSHLTDKEDPIMDFKHTDQHNPADNSLLSDPADNTGASVDMNHLVTAPLIQGLNASLNDISNMEQMHALSQDIGAALQAAIKGLLTLHDQVDNSRYGIMNKNLQPIEDNPIRLGLSYNDTMQALFDNQRSPVHLNAPAAINESLNNISHHNLAVQAAISEALSFILQALSPQVLLQRFKQYRHQQDDIHNNLGSWAWEMYENYYAELMSNRQTGFDKLFWEVFDQVYDKKIREHNQEVNA